MAIESKFVFCWKWPDEKLAFVFWGDQLEPNVVFAERYASESDLNDHLRKLDKQPELAPESMRFAVFANAARTAVRGITERLKAEGWRILSSRDRATIDAGEREARPVYVQTAWGRSWYPSCRAAARALNVDPSAVTLMAQSKNPKIQYADQLDDLLS